MGNGVQMQQQRVPIGTFTGSDGRQINVQITQEWWRPIDQIVKAINGVLPVANGGTGTTTPSLIAGPNISISGVWPNQTISGSGGGAGAVTSVGLSAPSFLKVSNSPITDSGTLALSYSGTALPVANGGTGTATPNIVAGSNITVTGTWPNQTVAVSSGGGIGFTFSTTAPSTPNVGDEWVDANSGILYVWVNDGTSTQWVEF